MDQQVEIINLKINPADMSRLLTISGIYPSYHMNKKSWISLVLDEQVSDNFLFLWWTIAELLTAGKALGILDGPDYWIIPANLKYYDIDAEFASYQIVGMASKGQY